MTWFLQNVKPQAAEIVRFAPACPRGGLASRAPPGLYPVSGRAREERPSSPWSDTLMARKTAFTVESPRGEPSGPAQLCHVGHVQAIERAPVMDFRAKRPGEGPAPAAANKDLRQGCSALSYAVGARLLGVDCLLRWEELVGREPQRVVRVIGGGEFAGSASAWSCGTSPRRATRSSAAPCAPRCGSPESRQDSTP